jgi:hypothetical protein
MKMNLKRGLLAGSIVSVSCSLLFAAFWYFTLPPGMGEPDDAISRWWKGSHVSATLRLAAVVFTSSGVIAFVMGAFRPDTRSKHETSA